MTREPPPSPADAEVEARVAAAFQRACLAELTAMKPGNVHIFAPGHRMQVADFERSAAVAAPFVARRGASVGARVREAMAATMAAVGQNTNLGILLLSAPIARAAELGGDLAASLGRVLDGLDIDDARDVFAAIAGANPGGLGRADRHDVTGPATVTLLEAMAAAADRDEIARQYVTGFAAILAAAASLAPSAPDDLPPAVVTRLYLTYLSSRPDSHVVRKWGRETALAVQAQAQNIVSRLDRPGATEELRHLDASWKSRGINPGTSADLTVATIFLHFLTPSK